MDTSDFGSYLVAQAAAGNTSAVTAMEKAGLSGSATLRSNDWMFWDTIIIPKQLFGETTYSFDCFTSTDPGSPACNLRFPTTTDYVFGNYGFSCFVNFVFDGTSSVPGSEDPQFLDSLCEYYLRASTLEYKVSTTSVTTFPLAPVSNYQYPSMLNAAPSAALATAATLMPHPPASRRYNGATYSFSGGPIIWPVNSSITLSVKTNVAGWLTGAAAGVKPQSSAPVIDISVAPWNINVTAYMFLVFYGQRANKLF